MLLPEEEVGIGDIYGEHNYNFNFGLEDTLGFNESFSLAYTRAEFDNQEENLFSRSYSSNLSFPIGYYTFSSAYSGSAYSQPQLQERKNLSPKEIQIMSVFLWQR